MTAQQYRVAIAGLGLVPSGAGPNGAAAHLGVSVDQAQRYWRTARRDRPRSLSRRCYAFESWRRPFGPLEPFQEKWFPLFRPKLRHDEDLERFCVPPSARTL